MSRKTRDWADKKAERLIPFPIPQVFREKVAQAFRDQAKKNLKGATK